MVFQIKNKNKSGSAGASVCINHASVDMDTTFPYVVVGLNFERNEEGSKGQAFNASYLESEPDHSTPFLKIEVRYFSELALKVLACRPYLLATFKSLKDVNKKPKQLEVIIERITASAVYGRGTRGTRGTRGKGKMAPIATSLTEYPGDSKKRKAEEQ
ncbi:hypothetical protein VKT23_011861 [Stygiomarasmius scandens]|uniref:Uncharacterized protein n=1 Tax=Marasmiellus scandens TaxID=2682957 RepID=A0ABR1J757_9AGAR